MRIATIALVSLALTCCTATDDQRAREQARKDGEVVKHEAKEALHEAKVDTVKAGKEIDKGFQETRDKVRKALDAPPAR